MTKYEDRTVDELKDALRAKDLPVSGTKDELIARLRGEEPAEAPAAEAPPVEAAPAVTETPAPSGKLIKAVAALLPQLRTEQDASRSAAEESYLSHGADNLEKWLALQKEE